MAVLDIQFIRNLPDADLIIEIEDKRAELFNMRFQQASGQLEDTTLLRQAKRDLARLLTVQRERQLAAQLAEEEEING
jgi:large subunit ribosomal protein L29